MIRLSKRLQSVADFVNNCGTMADVGTDHGYIPVYLAECGKIKRAIAMDINQGPLLRAKEHIRQHHLEERIETRLSDGLTALVPGEAETIVIAGMGGGLMKRILAEGEDTARAARTLILQPQSEVGAFREFLCEREYRITDENMVFEDGKYYSIIVAEYYLKNDDIGLYFGQSVSNCHSFHENDASEVLEDRILYQYGPLLLRQRHPVLKQYLLRQQRQKQEILRNLKQNARRDAKDRLEELSRDLEDIEAALNVF